MCRVVKMDCCLGQHTAKQLNQKRHLNNLRLESAHFNPGLADVHCQQCCTRSGKGLARHKQCQVTADPLLQSSSTCFTTCPSCCSPWGAVGWWEVCNTCSGAHSGLTPPHSTLLQTAVYAPPWFHCGWMPVEAAALSVSLQQSSTASVHSSC